MKINNNPQHRQIEEQTQVKEEGTGERMDRQGSQLMQTQTQSSWRGVEEVNTRAGEGTFPLGLVTMLFLVLFVWGCAGKESEETQKQC